MSLDPGLEAVVGPVIDALDPADSATFRARLARHLPDLRLLLEDLYGGRDDFDQRFAAIVETAALAFATRPADLKALDAVRSGDPGWVRSHRMMGGVCYVDRFAGTLDGVRRRISYFEEMGITYLHLMPLFRTSPGGGDGGYAVSSYREVAPHLGTMRDLQVLASDLRTRGISLVLDLVFNHTGDDHEWALAARDGDEFFRDFFFMFPDREMPDRYEKTLREIFPDVRRGSFTRVDADWVWTTFHSYQWDLDYSNPEVFRHMLGEMLFLANIGTEVLRLDAVPFIWKQEGTPSENLPQGHTIIRAFNALVRMAAPAMVFKSEAIVHPDDVVSYLGTGEWAGRECEISYNPLLMVELWEALATGYTALLTHSMDLRFARNPDGTAWINYVRSHDDIGWGFADEDAEDLGIHGFFHRQYLNRFFTGEEADSFASGLPFQFNPETLDMRISGTTASLCGLEKALESHDPSAVDRAVARILLIHSIVLAIGGIPLIFLGDEIGTLNDYSYLDDPDHAGDSRWVHRPPFDWDLAEQRHDAGSIPGRIYGGLQRLIAIRTREPAFGADSRTAVLDVGNPHVFAVVKSLGEHRILILGSFVGTPVTIDFDQIPWLEAVSARDLVTGRALESGKDLLLESYGFAWLVLS